MFTPVEFHGQGQWKLTLVALWAICLASTNANKIFISHDLGQGVCNALASYEKDGTLSQPPKDRPGSPHNCGFYRWESCSPPCSPIPEMIQCSTSPIPKATSSNTSNGPQVLTNKKRFPGSGQDSQRIVGGTDALRDKYPSIIYLRIQGNAQCGGTLIKPDWILTAAHCLADSNNPKDYVATAGEYDRNDRDDTFRQTKTASKVFVHPDYKPGKEFNDIGLINVVAYELTSRVQCAELPSPGHQIRNPKLQIVGWGQLSENGKSAKVLQEAVVPLVEPAKCLEILDKHLGQSHSILMDKTICAGYTAGGIDACQGDSGGPIFEETDGGRVIVGLVSWGDGCARPGLPGVYTRVAEYLSWIDQVINSNS